MPSGSQIDRATWIQVLSIERAYYLEEFESGQMSGEVYTILEDFISAVTGEVTAMHLKVCRWSHPCPAHPTSACC